MEAAANRSPVETLSEELALVRAESDRLRVETTKELIRLEYKAKQIEAELIARVEAEARRGAVPPPLALVSDEATVPGVKTRKPAPRKRPHPPKRPGVIDHSDHPFPRAVGNISAWAKENRVSRSRARSWYVVNDAKLGIDWGKAIPRRFAMQLLKSHGIPLDCWPNGILEKENAPRKKRKVPPRG